MTITANVPPAPPKGKNADKGEYQKTPRWKIILEVSGVALLLLYTVFAFLQWRAMREGMRIDQRPWIKVTSEMTPQIKEGDVLSANVHVAEFGKTPAKDPVADFVIAKVVNGEPPTFEYALNHERVGMGLLYPNDSAGVTFYRIDPFNKDSTIRQPLSAPEFDEFQKGKIFFVLYGKVTYTDFFRVEHWTHYCIPFISPTAATGSYKKCTAYNDIDDNS